MKNQRFYTKKSKIIINLLVLYIFEYKIILKNISNEIVFKNTFNYSLFDAAKKSIEFIETCSKGILYTNCSKKINENPKVSVVVPAYNIQKYIKQSIRSIQNQEFEELEIVIVNDFSTDNTSKIIEEIRKEDNRIKVINNKKNLGSLYTRCIGALIAKSKYIFPLDGDDMILDKDIIYKIYNLAQKTDIVVFKAIMVHQIDNLLKLENLISFRGSIRQNIIIHQPTLSKCASIVLWSQCIRAKIYKKAINIYGIKNYSIYLVYFEDAIINHIIYQIAESSAYIQIYGILYLSKKESISHTTTERERDISYMKYIEIMIDFSRNTFELRNKIVNSIIYFFKTFKTGKIEFYYLIDSKYKKELDLLIRKIFSSNYLSFKNKLEIRKIISNIILDF